jgi:hypothetical protein
VGPVLLAASASGVTLVLRGPDRLFGWAVGATVVLVLGWVLACALFPARADRRCPDCGAEALERLDRSTTRGLACRACGRSDAHASSFLLAEAEGPLEPIVLAERSRRAAARRTRAAGGASAAGRASEVRA